MSDRLADAALVFGVIGAAVLVLAGLSWYLGFWED